MKSKQHFLWHLKSLHRSLLYYSLTLIVVKLWTISWIKKGLHSMIFCICLQEPHRGAKLVNKKISSRKFWLEKGRPQKFNRSEKCVGRTQRSKSWTPVRRINIWKAHITIINVARKVLQDISSDSVNLIPGWFHALKVLPTDIWCWMKLI